MTDDELLALAIRARGHSASAVAAFRDAANPPAIIDLIERHPHSRAGRRVTASR